jgi:hypothetical protein
MTVLEGLFSSLLGKLVGDVRVAGYLERTEGRPQFVPWSRVWYLELESQFLRLEAVKYERQLAMRLVQDIEAPVEFADEDEEFAVASFGDLFFDTSGPSLPITKIRYVTDDSSDPAGGVVRLVEFELRGPQRIVFDPMWFFGIRPGPTGVYERLVADGREAGQTFTEHVWPN